ncbi:MAG: MotA/TolQ/ExbB proton channel family protein [Bacteroides sp.]|nr:MotA/TolQ/ExbB proton channel family protein [Ruminococcus flavefaciens]MCM1553889.1 MotA/TolQ/ExbB proton channel family protein [Bacteroides sp.]
MNTLTTVMFWIASGFLIPVVIGLLYFFVRSILLLGGFVSKYVQRSRMEKEVKTAMENLNESNVRDLKFSPEISSNPLVKCINSIISNKYNEAVVNKTVSEYELACGKELDQAKILVKFGPILGLMGTLIPMGPALAGLSSGDIASMAYNMQVAFATTVLGLFAGAVGFVLYQTKQRWAQKDLVRLDFVCQLMKQSQNA